MAAYAAANQFLDGAAYQLRGRGIAALSVDWGTWDELGRATAEARASYLRGGLHPMPSGLALDALGRAIEADLSQVTIARIDWTALKNVYEARRPRSLLARVSNPETPRTAPPAAPTPAADPLAALGNLSEAERPRRVLDLVRREAAAVLAVRPDEVDPNRGLFEMGMDSLMSVELRARLERVVGKKLPSTLTFNYPNVRALTGYLIGVIAPRPAEPAPAAPTPAAPPAPRASTDSQSEDDLAALLSDALKSLE
jgi:acyl carrier protein